MTPTMTDTDNETAQAANKAADTGNGNAAKRFRAYAAARLRGDSAEAARIADTIDDAQRMSHLLFQISLFTQIVVDHLGDRPDPFDLAELTKQLHHKHFRPGSTFEALRCEAMVRAICDESIFLTEIPHIEQSAYMWPVMTELVDPAISDTDLAELFETAETIGRDIFKSAIESPVLQQFQEAAKGATE
jgi:hypothetical protein